MDTIKIENPPKSWWPGDPRVEKFMPPVRDAIRKYLPWPSPQYTDIYNRAYEAVYNAILEADNLKVDTYKPISAPEPSLPARSKKPRKRKR